MKKQNKQEMKNLKEKIEGLKYTLDKYSHNALGTRRLNKSLKIAQEKLDQLKFKESLPKKIGMVTYDNWDNIMKGFMKVGMSRRRAGDLLTDFWEIEGFYRSFMHSMSKISKTKSKKIIYEELDGIQSELCIHIIPSHFLPARTTLMKAGFKYDILPEFTHKYRKEVEENAKRMRAMRGKLK